MAFDYLARVGAGVNPDSMHAERVDGYNPLAVADAIRRKRELIEKGEGQFYLRPLPTVIPVTHLLTLPHTASRKRLKPGSPLTQSMLMPRN